MCVRPDLCFDVLEKRWMPNMHDERFLDNYISGNFETSSDDDMNFLSNDESGDETNRSTDDKSQAHNPGKLFLKITRMHMELNPKSKKDQLAHKQVVSRLVELDKIRITTSRGETRKGCF